jgi:hypothetical protein
MTPLPPSLRRQERSATDRVRFAGLTDAASYWRRAPLGDAPRAKKSPRASDTKLAFDEWFHDEERPQDHRRDDPTVTLEVGPGETENHVATPRDGSGEGYDLSDLSCAGGDGRAEMVPHRVRLVRRLAQAFTRPTSTGRQHPGEP